LPANSLKPRSLRRDILTPSNGPTGSPLLNKQGSGRGSYVPRVRTNERPAHERSQLPQNRRLTRWWQRPPTLALAVADEATLIHRSERGGMAPRGGAKLTPDRARREARAILLQRRRAWSGRSILTISGRITKLRLVRPGSLVSNEIAFLGYPPEATYTDRVKSRGLIHEDRDRILRSMRL